MRIAKWFIDRRNDHTAEIIGNLVGLKFTDIREGQSLPIKLKEDKEMREYIEVYVRNDGYTLSEEEYHALVRRETEELFPEWWEERSENYGTKEEGFKVLLQKMYESDSDFRVMCKCVKCGKLVGINEGHNWDHLKRGGEVMLNWNEIAYDALETYLLGEGSIIIFEDGNWDIEDAGSTNMNAIARVRCLDGDVDETFFTEDFVLWNDEEGYYEELVTGRKVGDLEDVIRECIKEGDMERYIEEIERKLKKSYMED